MNNVSARLWEERGELFFKAQKLSAVCCRMRPWQGQDFFFFFFFTFELPNSYAAPLCKNEDVQNSLTQPWPMGDQ